MELVIVKSVSFAPDGRVEAIEFWSEGVKLEDAISAIEALKKANAKPEEAAGGTVVGEDATGAWILPCDTRSASSTVHVHYTDTYAEERRRRDLDLSNLNRRMTDWP